MIKNKYLNSFLALLAGNGFSQAVNFLFILLLVRTMSTEYYAVYRQGNLIITTFAPILTFGFSMSISYFLPKSQTIRERKTYVFQTVLVLLLTGVLWWIILSCFSELIGGIYHNKFLVNYLWLFGVVGLCENLYSFYPFFMCSEGRNAVLAKVVSVFSLIKCSTLLIYYVFQYNVHAFFLAYMLTEVIKVIYILLDTLMFYKNVNVEFSVKTFSAQLVFGVPIALSNIVTSFNKNIDKNIVSMNYSPKSFAMYSNGAFEVPLISVVRQSITGAFLPFFSKEYDARNQKSLDHIVNVFKRSAAYSAAFIIPLMFSLLLYSKGAVLIIFSEKYLDALLIFQFYLLLLPTQITDFGTPLVTAGKQQYIVLYRTIGTFLNFTLCMGLVFLLKDYRMIAIVPVLTEYVVTLLTLRASSKIFNQKNWLALLPWKEMLLFSLVSFIVCLVFHVFGGNIPIQEPIRSLIFGFFCLICCTLPCFLWLKHHGNNFSDTEEDK